MEGRHQGHDREGEGSSSHRDGKCTQFIPRKHKFCTGTVSTMHGGDGSLFCSIHKMSAAARVPCPLDPRHDVKESELQHHVKVCSSKQVSQSPYFKEDVNFPRRDNKVQPEVEASGSPPRKLRDLCEEEGNQFLHWLAAQHALVCQQAWWHTMALSPNDREVSLDAYVAAGDRKHRLQQSILCHLLLHKDDETTPPLRAVVEVGAGKGGVATVLKMLRPQVDIALVERSTFRDPKEKEINKQLRRSAQHLSDATHNAAVTPIRRIALDAKDFNTALWLSDVLSTNTTRDPCVVGVVGKHLCGACSDFALRITQSCVFRQAVEEGEPSGKRPREAEAPISPRSSRLVLATCCHHLCDYEAYVGRNVTVTTSSGEAPLFPSSWWFEVTRSICSWAIIENGEETHGNKEEDHKAVASIPDAIHAPGDAAPPLPVLHWTSSLTTSEKMRYGRCAKTLMDAGRIRFLQEEVCGGVDDVVSYVEYTTGSVSGERFAIVMNYNV